MKYQDAYNKIIEAYFKDEIKPFYEDFCFCGTLCGGSSWAKDDFDQLKEPYSNNEYRAMEAALLSNLRECGIVKINGLWMKKRGVDYTEHSNYEDLLFRGMCDALDVLDSIHRERGENVDELPKLTKRQLV
jgi:hypothetical protein